MFWGWKKKKKKKNLVFVKQVIYSRGAMNVKLKFKDFEVLLCVVILHALKTVYNLSAMALPTGENGSSSGLGINQIGILQRQHWLSPQPCFL